MSLDPEATLMYCEAAQAGEAVRSFLDANAGTLARLGDRLRKRRPSIVLTCGRGSSDHALTYGKYVIESMCGVPVASVAPSIASVFGSVPADLSGAVLVAVSQSGRSPDLLSAVKAQAAAGAFVIVLVNDISSPLAKLADVMLPLSIGPERSVAATKSCIVSMVGLAAIAAAWAADANLAAVLEMMPQELTKAFARDWGPALAELHDAASAFVIGRGYGYGIAQEVALKLKETCGLHAESFSAAEVRHGPMAIVHSGFPVVALATSDSAGTSVREVAETFVGRRAKILIAGSAPSDALLTGTAHPIVEPVLMLVSFYRAINTLAIQRGLSPDEPPFLAKVTQTI